jgi:hypothetical protein
VWTIKRSATELAPNQPNGMEAWFAHLEALVTNMASNMVTQMKPTFTLSDYLAQDFNLGFFCGVGLSRSLGLNEIKWGIPDHYVLWVVDGKTQVRVSTTTLTIRASA